MFGWQQPCYLLGEGYAKTFKELMEETDWDAYGVGNYEKCADCMVHCGFEATAVTDIMKHPLKALAVAMRGVKTDGPMAKDIPLDNQRPAKFVFSTHVEKMLEEIKTTNPKSRRSSAKRRNRSPAQGRRPDADKPASVQERCARRERSNARCASLAVRSRAGSSQGRRASARERRRHSSLRRASCRPERHVGKARSAGSETERTIA